MLQKIYHKQLYAAFVRSRDQLQPVLETLSHIMLATMLLPATSVGSSVPLISNVESMRRGRPSLLATVETIAATAMFIWLAWRLNSIEHIVVASALAPFLLLRTPLSTRYTIRVLSTLYAGLTGVAEGGLLIFSIPIIKSICSIRTVVRQPAHSISLIPTNFYKSVFVLDFGIPPNVIPGIEELQQAHSTEFDVNAYQCAKGMFRIIQMMYHIVVTENIRFHDIHKNLIKSIVIGVLFLLFMLCYSVLLGVFGLIALSFRYSVKSTALVWLPLLWIIYQAQPGARVLDRMYVTVNQPWYKVVLSYSIIVIVGVILKAGLMCGVWRFVQLDWLGPLGTLATRLVAPLELPLWQVTSAVNAGLAWAFFWRAKRHILARNSTEAWPEAWSEREYVAFQAVRTTLSVYTIACTFYIAAATAWQTEWPPIHFILFPWTAS